MKNEPAVVVLAAGAGSRYRGTRHKLSEPLGRDSVLVRTLRNALASELPVVLVISQALAGEARGLVDPGDCVVVDAASQPAWGMGNSIAAGVSIHASAGGWLVLPADIAEDDIIEFSTVGAYGAATATRFKGYGTSAMAIVEDVFSG